MEQYTQIPNYIIDEWMSTMKSSSFKVLMVICRKTLGWQKDSDYISQSQIMKITGLSKNAVIRALTELKDKELIYVVERQGATTNYTLNLTSSKMEPVSKENEGSAKMEPEPVPKVNTQKKNKKTITKESSSHHKLINYFSITYQSIYKSKLIWLPRYNKDIQSILKLTNEEEIYNRLKIFESHVKDNINNKFWCFTPDVFYSQFNKLTRNNIDEPETFIGAIPKRT